MFVRAGRAAAEFREGGEQRDPRHHRPVHAAAQGGPSERQGPAQSRILRRGDWTQSGGGFTRRGRGVQFDAGRVPSASSRPQEAARQAQGERSHSIRVRRPHRRRR